MTSYFRVFPASQHELKMAANSNGRAASSSLQHAPSSASTDSPAQEIPDPGCSGLSCCCCMRTRKCTDLREGLYEQRFSKLDFVWTIGGILTFVWDIGSDIALACMYWTKKRYWFFGFTLFFVALPSIVLQLFSLKWYLQDESRDAEESEEQRGRVARKKPAILSWLWRSFLHFLQLGTIVRYIRTLKYGCESQQERERYQYVVYEWADVCMLRLFEAFLESAPQLTLQLYILAHEGERDLLTIVTCAASLVSLAWALVAYHKALREVRPDKKNLSFTGVGLRMMWRLFEVVARVVALSLFAAKFEWIMFVVVGVHFILMFLWLLWQDTKFCDNRGEEWVFDFVMAIVHVFCWFNVKEGRTRYRAAAYYTFVYLENAALIGLWYWKVMDEDVLYKYAALVLVLGGFLAGIIIMVLYYLFFHPNGGVHCCVQEAEEVDSPMYQTAIESGQPALPWDEVDGGKQADKQSMLKKTVVVMKRTGTPMKFAPSHVSGLASREKLDLAFVHRWRVRNDEVLLSNFTNSTDTNINEDMEMQRRLSNCPPFHRGGGEACQIPRTASQTSLCIQNQGLSKSSSSNSQFESCV
ncbi:XK-related protein 6-like [Branchiostoma floridae x Branchiostoma japonicum]